jgi:Lrp/AsnC family leucine-responsive transcriptional regulator
MSPEIEKLLDDTGWNLLSAIQENARISYTELGQQVGLTSPAVTDRIRRMEDAGIISGYHARIDYARIGLPVMAVIHLEEIGGHTCEYVAAQMSQMKEVIECIRTTGDDSMIIKVVASSVDHLTRVLDQISRYGIPNTTIARPNPMVRTVITPDVLDGVG